MTTPILKKKMFISRATQNFAAVTSAFNWKCMKDFCLGTFITYFHESMLYVKPQSKKQWIIESMWMRKGERKKGVVASERELWMHMLSRLTFNCSIESVVSKIQNRTLFSMTLVTCKAANEKSQLLFHF